MNNIEKLALKNIKLKKEENEKNAQENLNFLMQNSEFSSIYARLTEININNAKNEVFGNTDKIIDTKPLQLQLESIAKKLGYSLQSTKPTYSCPKCCDCGYVDYKQCECLKKEINKLLLEKSNLTSLPDFSDTDFSIFDNPNVYKTLYEKMEKWASENSKYKNIVFIGKTGVGKSHLTLCIAKRYIDNNNTVCFTSAFNLNQDIYKFNTTREEFKSDILSNYLECDLLIIDDLGSEPIFQQTTTSGLLNILNERTFAGKKTIITTNLGLGEIDSRYDGRFFSRLADKNNSLLIKLENKDLRLKL